MKPLNTILSTIARRHLGVETLQTRRSDRLDFHDLAVWRILDALEAAYKAGLASCPNCPSAYHSNLPARFDGYEINPCRRLEGPDDPGRFYFEPREPHEADVWTLYGHVAGEGVHAIGDFETRKLAEEVFARITGQRYTESTNLEAGA